LQVIFETIKIESVKKIDWILIILAAIVVAVLAYRAGKRDQQFDALTAQATNQDSRISAVEDSLAAHEQRWHLLNSVVDWVRGFLPWK